MTKGTDTLILGAYFQISISITGINMIYKLNRTLSPTVFLLFLPLPLIIYLPLYPIYIYSCLNKIYAGAKVIIPCPSVKYTFVSTYFSIELLLFLLATLIPASARADNANNSDQSVTLLASPVFGAFTFGFLSSFVFAGVLASSLL